MPTVLGVDSSTQSTKVELRDADDGQLLAQGRAAHPASTPPRSEQDPESWWTALGAACGRAGIDRYDAVATAGQPHGLVVLDSAGSVVRPAKLWNDTESAPDAASLLDQLDGGGAAWAAACGSVPVASFTITKLSWLHRVEPGSFARLAHVLLPHDWLTFRLTGELVTDRGDASGTGYWSAAEDRYRFDLLALIDDRVAWDAAVPTVLGPRDSVPSRSRGGAPPSLPGVPARDVVVAPGTGDNMAAALGVGLTAGDLAVSIGTSGTAFAVSERPTADQSGAVAGFADATGRFLPLVCTLNATKVTDAIADLLAVDLPALDALALAAEPGAAGLTLIPYFDGERTPNRPDASGTLAGLRTDVTRGQVARAAFEGVVCGLLDGVDALHDAGVESVRSGGDGRLVLVGGGARSPAYRQILADLSGRPVTVPATDELVALGACVQAASVHHGRSAAEVADAWSLRAGHVTEPTDAGREAAAEVRAGYAEVSRRSSG